jgi:hypothetical protein
MVIFVLNFLISVGSDRDIVFAICVTGLERFCFLRGLVIVEIDILDFGTIAL